MQEDKCLSEIYRTTQRAMFSGSQYDKFNLQIRSLCYGGKVQLQRINQIVNFKRYPKECEKEARAIRIILGRYFNSQQPQGRLEDGRLTY